MEAIIGRKYAIHSWSIRTFQVSLPAGLHCWPRQTPPLSASPGGSSAALTAVLTGFWYLVAMAYQSAASLISSAPRMISTVSMYPSREQAFSVVMTTERLGPISLVVILP